MGLRAGRLGRVDRGLRLSTLGCAMAVKALALIWELTQMNILTIRELAVKVSHVPARKAAFVQLHNVIDLGPTGTAFGYLAQLLVE